MKLYAFDVDETLEVSVGPIPMAALKQLFLDGDIVGLCGNWARVTGHTYGWWHYISFVGPIGSTKEEFLMQLQRYIAVEEVVMVGNILGVSGTSDDEGAAQRAGVRFISEKDFANGSR